MALDREHHRLVKKSVEEMGKFFKGRDIDSVCVVSPIGITDIGLSFFVLSPIMSGENKNEICGYGVGVCECHADEILEEVVRILAFGRKRIFKTVVTFDDELIMWGFIHDKWPSPRSEAFYNHLLHETPADRSGALRTWESKTVH